MARYKIIDRSPKLLPVVLDARYNNDETGAPAYHPAVMLKIVLLAYSRGMISSRAIERACRENVVFMALSGDSAPQFTTIAKFVKNPDFQENLRPLHDAQIPALIADGQMRKRDERFKGQDKYKALPDFIYDKSKTAAQLIASKSAKHFKLKDFTYDPVANACICPAGKQLYSNGSSCSIKGRTYHKLSGAQRDCGPCSKRAECLRHPDRTPVRQVVLFKKLQTSAVKFIERMKRAIDSALGMKLYGQRMATVEPVFGNLRYNKRLDRFTLRGLSKVNTQWHLFCMVHNIEKLSHHGYAA